MAEKYEVKLRLQLPRKNHRPRRQRPPVCGSCWCCYITIDFATAASVNGVYINQEMCHIMILFHNCSTIKGGCYKNTLFFCHVLNNIGFSYEGEACMGKMRFVMQPLQNPTLCSSTICLVLLHIQEFRLRLDVGSTRIDERERECRVGWST